MSQELQRIARDFRRLSGRFEGYARRSRKVSHLNVNVSACAVQAGRLLVAAIDGGAFPKSSRQENGEWWDRREGRVPGGPLAVLGGWEEGRPSPSQESEYLTAVAGLSDAKQFAACWTFAVGSWLVRAFPDRFRHNAGSWDWTHILTDDEGHPIGRDGKRLVGRWYKNGKPLPRNSKALRRGDVGKYEWRLKGQLVRREELYDKSDRLAHLRVRAEVYCDACLVLSDLIGPERHGDAPLDELVTLSQVAPLMCCSKRTLERYLQRGQIPQPDFRGGAGKSHKWYWSTLRPDLEKVCPRLLPVRFPGSRII